MNFLSSILIKSFILGLIKIYQRTLSFDHGVLRHFFPYGHCRFYPSCSEYGYQAIQRHGLRRGALMAIWRIIRCNPWGKGGHDPVK